MSAEDILCDECKWKVHKNSLTLVTEDVAANFQTLADENKSIRLMLQEAHQKIDALEPH
jgi:hypothetical protein